MTIKLDRKDVTRIILACGILEFQFNDEMKNTKDEELKERKRASMEMWKRIHDELEEQLKKYDMKEEK